MPSRRVAQSEGLASPSNPPPGRYYHHPGPVHAPPRRGRSRRHAPCQTAPHPYLHEPHRGVSFGREAALRILHFIALCRSSPMKYRVLIEHDEDGVFVAPSLPGCISQGATRQEALSGIREAMTLYLESLAAHGDPIQG